jgi:hypothetical protein
MKSILLVLGVVVLMAVSGGAGYYLGTDNGLKQAQNIRAEFLQQRMGNLTGAAPTGDSTPSAQGQRGAGQGQVAALGGRPVAQGTVKSVEGNKVTVTQQDGTATTITVDDKTTIQKQVNGALADLTAGTRIIVTEQGNTRRIQIVTGQ